MLFDELSLDWLPDETIFSLASRYHLVSGNATPRATCLQLFGAERIGSSHDMPARVDFLSRRMNGRLGQPDAVCLQHSIAPFYFPFHSLDRCRGWLVQMGAGSPSHLKAQLGLYASRFGSSHPLKYCPECSAEDLRSHHVSYWRLSLQLPGVWICPVHGLKLEIAVQKWMGLNRFGWTLPEPALNHSRRPDASAEIVLRSIADGAQSMWKMPLDFQFQGARLRATYRAGMVGHGCMDHHGRTCHSSFERLLGTTTRHLADTDELACLADPRVTKQRILRYLSPSSCRDVNHPLFHIVLATAIFGRWSAFWDAYSACEPADTGGRVATFIERTSQTIVAAGADERKLQLQRLLLIDGLTPTGAAQRLGIATGTAMAWAADYGFHTLRRPKLIKDKLRDSLINLLKRGAEKSVVAKATGVSLSSVTRVLLTIPGLHEEWVSVRFQAAQKQTRWVWERTVRKLPSGSSVEWRRIAPAAYAWLYRNDREWLQLSIRSRMSEPIKRDHSQNWHSRDLALVAQARSAVGVWLNEHGVQRLTITQLCSVMPKLKLNLSCLEKLPLTRAFLHEISYRRPKDLGTKSLL